MEFNLLNIINFFLIKRLTEETPIFLPVNSSSNLLMKFRKYLLKTLISILNLGEANVNIGKHNRQ